MENLLVELLRGFLLLLVAQGMAIATGMAHTSLEPWLVRMWV
jgi:hypothetical protein